MSLDIFFSADKKSLDWRMSFASDAYYWFLFPYFNTTAKTCGEMIDLYSNAEFHSGKGLSALQTNLEKALADIQELPERHPVHTGTQIGPVHKELCSNVEREQLLKLVQDLLALVDEVKACGAHLICHGD